MHHSNHSLHTDLWWHSISGKLLLLATAQGRPHKIKITPFFGLSYMKILALGWDFANIF
jgi:hypothetical protein